MMTWLRRIAAVPLLLVAFVSAIGALKAFRNLLPDAGVGSGIFYALIAAAFLAGACFLLLPDVRRLRAFPKAELRRRILANPLAQAAVLYAAAAVVMIPLPKLTLLPGLVAQCAYSVLAPSAARKARSWWAHAALALLGFLLLMGALAGTAEALTPRGFGEAGMVFLLPMYLFLILLPISGIVRLVRGAKAKTEVPPNAGSP